MSKQTVSSVVTTRKLPKKTRKTSQRKFLSARHNSDDSVVIAGYMRQFKYEPHNASDILKYYQELEGKRL